MAAGAIAVPLAAAAAVFSLFRTRTKELDRGLVVTIDNTETLVESFRKVERSRFWGLSKRVKTTMDQASDDIANPIIDAVSGMQRAAISAAETLGVGADAFDGFSHEINISLRKLNEQQAMQRVSEELGKMGDAFASLVPGVESMNELLGVAQQRYDLTTRLLQLQGDEEELLRRHREQEVNAVHELNSELLLHIHSLEDAAIAAERAAEEAQNRIFLEAQIARERESIERRMLELQGDTAAIRERELEALDPANRALAENVFALEDHARAVEEASRAAEEAAKKDQAIQSEMQRLQARILQLQGDTNALRERELAGLSPTNRALQEMIFALEDSALAAEETAKMSEEAARKERAINEEMQRLQTRILQMQGETSALRERELEALSPANRALQEMIFALEDQAVAAEEAARASEEMTRKERAVNEEMQRLQTRILQLQGETSALRQRELEALSPANRALQEMIFALEDSAKAAEEASRAAEEAARTDRAIADEMQRLQTRILQLQGDTNALREREIAALHPTNIALQRMIFSLEDAAEAAEAAARAADELAREQQAIAQQRFNLESRILQLQGDTTALRQRELDAIDPANRALQEIIFSLEDAATAAEQAARAADELAQQQRAIAQEQFGLETRILQLQGDIVALRKRELDALDPANRSLQEMIFALEDAATAADEAARAAQELADSQRAIAQERFGLEGQILQLQGNVVALRQRELDALDPTNRSLQQLIFSLQDAASAAEEAARAADELAARQRAVAQERFNLESRLLQVQGNTAALRERELDALDPSNRQILENIFAVEDAQRRAEEAQRRAEERARIAQQKAEERAREQERIAQERFGLETKILQLQGKTTELRERELEALDPSNRSLQKFIFGLEDAKAALDAITASDFATGVEFDRARALARIAVEQSVPSFAGGGFHGGGLRLVGESGPELEVTGASRIYNNGDTINMLSNAPVVSELQQLRREIVSMRDEQRQLGIQTARNTDRSYRVLREWNVTGLPEERVA
jgi:hypothetical protein